MAERVTNDMLQSKFKHLMDVAAVRGISVDGWSFGQHFGLCYNIVQRNADGHGSTRISGDWLTKREAWQGMQDMKTGLLLVARV